MDKVVQEIAEMEASAEEVKDFYRKMADERGIDFFFLEVVRAKDSKKVGNLNKEELGLPPLPVRTLLDLANDCDKIPSMSSFAKDFKTQAENILATSLSKEGFLIKARITQKKEFLDKEKKKVKKGFFNRKEEVVDS